MISILGSHKHCYLAFSTRPTIHRLSSAPSIRPLDSPRSRGAPCDSILTWLNGGKELASAEELGKVEMKLGKVEKKLEMELGKVEMKLDKLEKQVAGIQSSLGLLSEGDLRAKASRRHLVGESIEIEHVEGLVGYLMGQFKTSGVRQVFSSADLTVQLCHSVLNLKAMLAFTQALTQKLKEASSLDAEVSRALDDLQKSSGDLSVAYTDQELGMFLDMTMDPIRERQGKDLLKHMELMKKLKEALESSSSAGTRGTWWGPFLQCAMTFKTALERSIHASDSTHLIKNIMSLKSLFVALWSTAATNGGSMRQRVQIDAIGGVVKTSSNTILNLSEFKSSAPDFSQVEVLLRTIEFAWISTASVHRKAFPLPIQLVARIFLPKGGQEKTYDSHKMIGNNMTISVEYI